MNSIPLLTSSFRIGEYQLILKPENELLNDIQSLCSKINESKWAFKNDPKLILIHFHMFELVEDKLIRNLSRLISKNPFYIRLDSSLQFTDTSVHIQIEHKTSLFQLIKGLKKMKRLMIAYPDQKPVFNTQSHISIATGIGTAQHGKEHFQTLDPDDSGNLLVKQLVLAKKMRDSSDFEEVSRFILEDNVEFRKKDSAEQLSFFI